MYLKARVAWIKDGEENSKFFHAMFNQRKKNNEIQGIFLDNIWGQGVSETKEATRNFFEKSYSCEQWNRTGLVLDLLSLQGWMRMMRTAIAEHK